MANQFAPYQAKYDDNDEDVNEENNDGV